MVIADKQEEKQFRVLGCKAYVYVPEQLSRCEKKLCVCQSGYGEKILERFRIRDVKAVNADDLMSCRKW